MINSLEGGGAERVFASIASALAERLPPGAVQVALLDRAELRYPLSPRIAIHTLEAQGRFARSLRGLLALARQQKPDLILSFLARANCAAVVVGRLLGRPVLISERVNTSSHFAGAGLLAPQMVRRLYPLAHGVIAVSHGVAEDLIANFGIRRARVQVIPNPVDLAALRALAAEQPAIPLPERFLAAVGRLAPSKNMPLLLRAFARLSSCEHLVILGEGRERPALEQLVQELGLQGRVHMPGFLANPYAVLGRALAYASSSNAEGFPNSLLEALALGVPALSTHCPSGPAELLADTPQVDIAGLTRASFGLLSPVGDLEGLAAGLELLLQDRATRAHYAQAGPRRAQAFRPEAVQARYAAAISDALPGTLRLIPPFPPVQQGSNACGFV